MLLSIERAWELIVEHGALTAPVRVSLLESCGQILAEEVFSTIDSPPFAKSMMDGFALRAADVLSGQNTFSIIEEIMAGQVPQREIVTGTASRIMTGAPIPAGADAVVPLEWTTSTSTSVTLQKQADDLAGRNILPRGQSMRNGEQLFRAGERIRAQTIAVMAEIGHAFPLVRQQPTVAILATGDELVDVGQIPGPGQIRNSNALMLAAQVREAGAVPRVLPIVRDEPAALHEGIQAGLESDLLILSGGVSAGELDLVPAALAAAGVTEIFHKVEMKPGKPCWFGIRPGEAGERPKPVFGLPGNPVSSMVCFELFVRLSLRRFTEINVTRPVLRTAFLSNVFRHRGDRPTFFPATVTTASGTMQVSPVAWKGSADLRSTAEANCSLVVPAGTVEWGPGTLVQFLPWGQTLAGIEQSDKLEW